MSPSVGLFVAAAAFLVASMSGLLFYHRHMDRTWVIDCLVDTVLAFFALIVVDYLGTHARWLYLPIGAVLIWMSYLDPRLGVGLALAVGYIAATNPGSPLGRGMEHEVGDVSSYE